MISEKDLRITKAASEHDHFAPLSCEIKTGFPHRISSDILKAFRSVFPQIRPFAKFPEFRVFLWFAEVPGIYGIQTETFDRFSVGIRKSWFYQEDNTEQFTRFLQP
jgi:hypothetical protein